MLKRIKQFGFYLSYELSLFQKMALGLGILMLITFIVFVGKGSFGKFGSASVLETGTGATMQIEKVDTQNLSGSGTMIAYYSIKNTPATSFDVTARVLNTAKQEIMQQTKKSSKDSDSIALTLPASARSTKTFVIELSTVADNSAVTGNFELDIAGNNSGSGSIIPLPSSSPTSTPEIPKTPTPSPVISPSVRPSIAPSPIASPANTNQNLSSSPIPNPSPVASILPRIPPSPLPTTNPQLPTAPPIATRTPVPPPLIIPPSPTTPVSSPPIMSCMKVGQFCTASKDCCSNRCANIKISWMGKPSIDICLPQR